MFRGIPFQILGAFPILKHVAACTIQQAGSIIEHLFPKGGMTLVFWGNLLNWVIWLPILAAFGLLLIPARRTQLLGLTVIGFTLVEFFLSTALLRAFPRAGFAYTLDLSWIPPLGAGYRIGVDGLSVLLIVLTTLLTFLGAVYSRDVIHKHVRTYWMALLLLEGFLIGVFAARDLFLFFLFWEAMLIPMFLLIGIWGHERRLYAAFKFFLYTMAGSVFLLAGVLYLGLRAGSFDLEAIQRLAPQLPMHVQALLFWGFMIAFAIKVPVVPFHTWLPDAHVEAPTVGSVLLAGVLLKMGTYGMLRFAIPFFPAVAVDQATLWMALGVVGILYGAWMSWVQKDMKRLIAYSSVAHMGFIVLGMFSFTVYGLSGGMLQMLNHGISTGALFFSVGMLYERRHSRLMEAFGGVAREMPVFAAILGIVAMSSLGLPGLNGFVGEFLSLLGAFQRNPVLGGLGVVGVIFAAVYLLHMLRQVLFLTPHTPREPLLDLNPREFFVFLPLLVLIFWIGVYPRPFLRVLDAPVAHIQQTVRPYLPTPAPVQEPAHTPEVHP